MKSIISLLDCTLRDGGYITEWNWGFKKASDIITFLVKANIDIIEVGFLKNVSDYNEDRVVCNRVEELNRLLPSEQGNSIFSAMAMNGNYDIDNLEDYCGTGIEMIRVTAHNYDIWEGLEFAERVKKKGYKVCINPINIMGYSDKSILNLIEKVNEIMPYQFSIVDTFGSMKRRDLDRLVSLIDNNLDSGIKLGLHLHENMAQSFYLAQLFIDKSLTRKCVIDGSLMGIGRAPGNLPIELIADYLKEYGSGTYDIDYMMDAIQDYIFTIKGKSEWGYSPVYFLSAHYNLHRNYAEFYLDKGDLTIREINHILARIETDKSTVFDKEYADKLYLEFMDHRINDSDARMQLQKEFINKSILILAPGRSIKEYKGEIEKAITKNGLCTVSLNFIPNDFYIQYAFFSNSRRLSKLGKHECKMITTSNLASDLSDYNVDYNSLTSACKYGNNSLLMLLKLLSQLGISHVFLAGADGFSPENMDYYEPTMISGTVKEKNYNSNIAKALSELKIKLTFLTPSEYERYYTA